MNEILPQDPIALLKAVSSLLPPEVAEQVRQLLAARAARYVNRGVHILSPDEGLDGIDPTNQNQLVLMHEHPGTLFPYGINGSTQAGLTLDKSKFVIVAADLLVQRRRHIIEIILHDYLGNRPAVSLAGPDLAPGLFLFSGSKTFPHELSEKNAKKLVDYFEEAQTDRWYYPYWKFADERARQVSHWLPRDESQP